MRPLTSLYAFAIAIMLVSGWSPSVFAQADSGSIQKPTGKERSVIAPPQKPTTVDKSKVKKPTAAERSGIAIENTPSEIKKPKKPTVVERSGIIPPQRQ